MATMTRTGTQLTMPTGPGALPLRPPARSDSLPEYTRYRDDGCDVHPHCLTCPLPRCRYEEPGGLRALLNEYRDRQIVRLRRRGMGVDELAGRFGVSRRTVFRVLGNNRQAAGNGAPIPIRKQAAERKAYCA